MNDISRQWGNLEVYLGWARGVGLVSDTIARFDSVPYSGQLYPSRFNHVFWKFEFEKGPSLIWESHIDHGVQETPWEVFEDAAFSGKVQYYWTHPMNLSQNDSVALYEACTKLHGKRYDTRHIFGLYLWIRLFGANHENQPWWMRWALNDKYICSEFTQNTADTVKIDLCGDISTPATTTPERQWMAIYGLPSAISFRPDQQRVIVKRVEATA